MQILPRRLARPLLAGLAAIALIAGVAIAQAQSVPPGSYLNSCTNVRVEGRTLKALCRAANGQQVPTEYGEIDNCRNDIVNENGRLNCKLGTQPPRGAAPAPGYGQQQPYGQNPPYGGGGGSGGFPAPYGQPPQGYGGGGGSGDRCDQLRGRYREIRERLNFTNDGYERERLQRRLGETRGELRASCGDPRD